MYLPAGKNCDKTTLAEIYGDEDVAETILMDASKHDTIDRIESGECSLPEPHEAALFHKRRMLMEEFDDERKVDAILANPGLEKLLRPIHGKKDK